MKKLLLALPLLALLALPAQCAPMLFVANLDGGQVAPTPVATPATGLFTAQIDPSETSVTLSMALAGLLGAQTDAGVFSGAPGVVGTFIAALPTGDFSGLVVPVTAGDVAAIRSGGLYIQVGTNVNPDGEIRGQLVAATPEPGTLGLVAAGGLAAVGLRRRKRA